MKIEKPAIRAIDAQHDDDEQRRRQIEGRDQAGEIAERLRAELADRVGHRAERADRRRLHDDGDDAEHGVRDFVDEGAHRVAALAQRHQREAEQDREQQHLQDVALREGADDACPE